VPFENFKAAFIKTVSSVILSRIRNLFSSESSTHTFLIYE